MQIIAISTIYAISPVITSSFPTTLIFFKIERSPNRNPNFSQSSELPLYKEKLRNLTKLRKVFQLGTIPATFSCKSVPFRKTFTTFAA